MNQQVWCCVTNSVLRFISTFGFGLFRRPPGHKRKSPARSLWSGTRRTAAAYSPNWWVSTIGDGELNFSVRNGKRWYLTAIATAVFFLRDITRRRYSAYFFSSVSRFTQPTLSSPLLQERNSIPAYTSSGKVSRAISTGRLMTSLPVHLPPIYVVVSNGPQGKSHLEEGFALRCFQRLSSPSVDTRRCSWRHNRLTRGWSDPVLSY